MESSEIVLRTSLGELQARYSSLESKTQETIEGLQAQQAASELAAEAAIEDRRVHQAASESALRATIQQLRDTVRTQTVTESRSQETIHECRVTLESLQFKIDQLNDRDGKVRIVGLYFTLSWHWFNEQTFNLCCSGVRCYVVNTTDHINRSAHRHIDTNTSSFGRKRNTFLPQPLRCIPQHSHQHDKFNTTSPTHQRNGINSHQHSHYTSINTSTINENFGA